ncbi:MAG: hypothetical protein ACYC6O_08375 [Thermoleophilia bacterium]
MKLVKIFLLMITVLFALIPVACGGEDDKGGGGEPVGQGETRANSVAASGSSSVIFTDVVSIPLNGYVTVWGKNLGTSGTLRVGGSVIDGSDCLSWGPDPNIPWLSRIEFRQTVEGAGAITVDGVEGSLPLSQHDGRNLFVDQVNGSDSSNGLSESNQGEGAGPWNTLPYARAQMRAGDVLYVRAGTYTEIDDETWGTMFHALEMDGTENQPYAIIGYPGETAVLDAGMREVVRRVFMIGDHWVVAKMQMVNGTTVGVRADGESNRVVGNVFTNIGFFDEGVITFDEASHTRILGNYLFDYGVPDENNSHGIYHGGVGSANTDLEVAYNRMVQQRGGRHIQLYGHTAGERTTNVLIHHNEIDTGPYDGILLGSSDAEGSGEWIVGVEVYDNTIRNNQRSCIYVGAMGEELQASIRNNVCYDSPADSILVTEESTGAAEIFSNCLDKKISNVTGRTTINAHDNEVNYPACERIVLH